MKLRTVKAVFMQEWHVTKSSWEVIFDIFIFSLASITLFGYISTYLTGADGTGQAQGLIIAVMFWEVIRITQYSVSVSTMWNVWSHNLSNMFIAPVRVAEYVLAHIASAVIKSAVMLSIAMLMARFIFKIDVLALGILPILFTYINMVIFATAVGMVLIGFVFQFGTKVQALTWGTIFMIQPFCAVFFPVSILPAFLQAVAYCFPVTYFFEWLRALHSGAGFNTVTVLAAFGFNLVYLLASSYIFSRQIAKSKMSGQLARNDL